MTHPLFAKLNSRPSIAVGSKKYVHKRSKSVNDCVDPDFYPLSSARKPSPHRLVKGNDTGSKTLTIHRPSRLRNLSADFTSASRSTDGLSQLSETSTPSTAQSRPLKPDDVSSRSAHRDSLCDSLYEPEFTIPSTTTLRRQKMARVCKVLGEGVPVSLVFPSEEHNNGYFSDDYDYMLDVCTEPSQTEETDTPPPLPPKTDIHLNFKQINRPLFYRDSSNSTASCIPMLETIEEQSPRSSFSSSSSSTESDDSFRSSTTSSSSHFQDKAPTPLVVTPHDHFTRAFSSHPIRGACGSPIRREFAVYVPVSQCKSRAKSSCSIEKQGTQEFEVIRGFTHLSI